MRAVVTFFAVAVMAGSTSGLAEPQRAPRIAQGSSQTTFCPEIEMPVCGTKDGKRVRYGNECKAKRDGATAITPGDCQITN
jgi:hypothetical protein